MLFYVKPPQLSLRWLVGGHRLLNLHAIRCGLSSLFFILCVVAPFLRLDWGGTPVVNADGSVSVKVKVTRGANQTEFHKNLMDITLFVNNNPYVGDNNYDSRFSPRIAFTGQVGNARIGEVIELKSTTPLPAQRDWYIRAGERVAHGLNIYNYSEPLTVTIP